MIKRYRIGMMTEDPEGAWIRYEDVEYLLNQIPDPIPDITIPISLTPSNEFDLILWPGDTDYVKFDVWPLMGEYYDNDYILRAVDYSIRLASAIVHKEFGIATVIKDLSSLTPVTIIDPETKMADNGHPWDTHQQGNGGDVQYHGWPVEWNSKATWRWLSIVKDCLPEFRIFAGSKVKKTLEILARKQLDWIIEEQAENGPHEYSNKIKSHFHCYFRWMKQIKVNMDKINEYARKLGWPNQSAT